MPTTSSQKQYLTTYLGLIKKSDSDDLKTIFEYIKSSDVKDTTKLSYLNSIISLKKMNGSLVKGNLSDIKEFRDELQVKIEKARDENNLNERQTKAMEKVKLEDLKKFVKSLDEKKKKSHKDLENYILVKIMTDTPIRNDLQEIAITRQKRDLQSPINVIYLPTARNKMSILSIKEYKTSKSNGDIIINLDEDLTNDIKKMVSDGRKFLFVNQKGEPLSSSSFTHKLNRLFNKEFGVPISSTIIRKIYLTGKYGNVLNEMKEDSKVMGHNLATQQKVYISNNKDKPESDKE